jgi:hypothetical protein
VSLGRFAVVDGFGLGRAMAAAAEREDLEVSFSCGGTVLRLLAAKCAAVAAKSAMPKCEVEDDEVQGSPAGDWTAKQSR